MKSRAARGLDALRSCVHLLPQVTAVTLLGLVVVGQALLPPPAAGAVRTGVAVLAAP